MQQRLSVGEYRKGTWGRLPWETNMWAELWRMGKNLPTLEEAPDTGESTPEGS